MIGYLMTEEARSRLERLKRTIDMIEILADQGSGRSCPGIKLEEISAFTSLVSEEVSGVLDDSAGKAEAFRKAAWRNGEQCEAFLELFARLGDQQRRDVLRIMQTYACTSDGS